jgi:chromosome segregation ATPase
MSEKREGRKKRKSRMTLPKKKEDLEKIVEEVQQAEAHDHHHHHHHHHAGEIDELLTVLELLVDSLNAQIETLQSRVSRNSYEIARLYKILGHILSYLVASDEKEKLMHLEEALSLLSPRKSLKETSLTP